MLYLIHTIASIYFYQTAGTTKLKHIKATYFLIYPKWQHQQIPFKIDFRTIDFSDIIRATGILFAPQSHRTVKLTPQEIPILETIEWNRKVSK